MISDMRAYHVALRRRDSLRREAFRLPQFNGASLWKPEGGFWLSLWKEGWGPEWGIWWVLQYDVPKPEVLQAPVWEVDLDGLEIRKAGLHPPDFSSPEVDGWLVLPETLEAEWEDLPAPERSDAFKWWASWDVSTVWLRIWPGEERIRFLGTLQEVCPERAVQAFLEALDRIASEERR